MSAISYDYFDEAYFQDGTKRGTAYVDYKRGARDSQTFKEIARAVREVFQPGRVLDVGCATGAIVLHLNHLGCEAHGVDVSQWAVNNAEHPNVKLASADNLPYPDNYFDLVMSCHSLEHLPEPVFERSLQEIIRVSSSFLFHMLPMVGTPPYTGHVDEVRKELQKDPTHRQIHSKEWWLQQFESLGCVQINTCVLLKNESTNAELSVGQFLLKKSSLLNDSDVLRRATSRNQQIFRELQLMRAQSQPLPLEGRLNYSSRIWKEAERRFEGHERIDLTRRTLQIVTVVSGSACRLRLAAGQDSSEQEYAHVGEFYLLANPGCTVFAFSAGQLATLRGTPDYSAVNHIGFGGENENAEVKFYVTDEHGTPILP